MEPETSRAGRARARRGPRRRRRHLRGGRARRRAGAARGSSRSRPGVVFGLEVAEEVFRQAGAGELRAARRRGRSGATRCPPRSRSSTGRPGRCSPPSARRSTSSATSPGIATLTARFVEAVAGTRRDDPRHPQDDPGAARAGEGGGRRRRRHATTAWASHDAILIKENHAALAGGVGAAVARRARGAAGAARSRSSAATPPRSTQALEAPAPTGCCSTTWTSTGCAPRSPRATPPRGRRGGRDARGLGRDHARQRRRGRRAPGSTSSRSAR